jgi:two-component system OmpR family sensor kinase
LALYIAFIWLLLTLFSLYYFQNQEKIMLSKQGGILSHYALIETKRLKNIHKKFEKTMNYPRDSRFNSAIYDLEYMRIFSLLEEKEHTFSFEEGIALDGEYLHFVYILDDYYLGTKYLIIEVKDDKYWQFNAWMNIMVYGFVSFFIFVLFGIYLMKLFLKPMSDSIMLLDRFIKDTTHELNTPLSAILANIEMMDKSVMVEKNLTKLNRINIAATTVSILYEDLTYLTLEQEQINKDEVIYLKELIYTRIEYFSILAESKKLSFELRLEDGTLYMDRRKFTRVLDNLISNAIKYNRRNGLITVILKTNSLSIEDSGLGIDERDIPLIFDRYRRFNDSEGGFGVGMSIVKSILDEYEINIEVNSIKNKGTTVFLSW